MVTPPPKIYTRLFHTIPQIASLHWTTTHICQKQCKYRYNRAFRHVHANRAATSRGFDMCINLVPNLGRRFMIVYVLDKLICWRACYFCSCNTKKTSCFWRFIVFYGVFINNIPLIIIIIVSLTKMSVCVGHLFPAARQASDSDAAS